MSREPVTHVLKCWPPYFQEIYQGRKTYEVRKNDRAPCFLPMDILRLREWLPATFEHERTRLLAEGYRRDEAAEIAADLAYTGRECDRMVGYMLYGGDPAVVGMEAAHAGVSPGYVVMSLVSTPNDAAAKRAAWEAGRPPPQPLQGFRSPE